jgi:serine/threonine protein kinase/WD40 repeat protein
MSTSCPDNPTLQALLQGQLLDLESERWEDHLAQCRTCVTEAASLTVVDALTRDTRRAVTGPPPLPIPSEEMPVLRDLLERVRLLHPAYSGSITGAGSVAEPLPVFEGPCAEGELGRIAHYRVLRLLGAGAMGLVFQAVDERLRRPVALKLLRPRFAQKPEARVRFLREGRAMAAIAHDHIVSVYHVDEAGTEPFLAMPLLEGQPLNAWLKNNPRPALTTVLRWGREIASGLAAAHERGLTHRDIKPGNLWVEAPGQRIKILDFGLAYFDRDEVQLTAEGIIVGTPAYMAPEQARGAPPDPRADLFSLGCVLYELCTGESPFRGESVLAVLSSLANDEPTSVRTRNPAVPVAVETLIMRLLAKQPANRPASASEVAGRLAELEVAPVPTGSRRKYRLIAATVLALVGLGVGVGVWLSGRAPVVPPTVSQADEDLPQPQPPSRPDRLVGHSDTVTALLFTQDGQALASASADRTVRLWALPDGTPTTLATHPDACTAMALNQKGDILASASSDGTIRMHDLKSGQVLFLFKEPERAWGLGFSQTGSLYVASNHGVIVWSAGQRIEKYFLAYNRALRMVTVDPKGRWVGAGGEDKGVYFTNTPQSQTLQIVAAHGGPVHSGASSPDGRYFATAGGPPDPRVCLWEPMANSRQRYLELHPGGATALAWAPDGKLVASGGVDGVVRLWDPHDGQVKVEYALHAPRPVTCLAFSPDGRFLASGGADQVIRLQDVSAYSGPPNR